MEREEGRVRKRGGVRIREIKERRGR